MRYSRPATVEEAVQELADDGALPLAGGVTLGVLMNIGLLEPEKLVSLNGIPQLRGITLSNGSIEIGALTTHAEIAAHPQLRAAVPSIRDAFSQVGNVRVRAWGTIGGNLAHADPASDPPVLLAALGAEVTAVGAQGERTLAVSSLSDGPFETILAPAEVLTRVVLRAPATNTRSAYIKFLPRTAEDYATVSAAAVVQLEQNGVVGGATLVLGSVGPTAVVCDRAAALVAGQRLDDPQVLEAVADAVRETVEPATDARGSADYKRQISGVIACRALAACAANGSPLRGGRP